MRLVDNVKPYLLFLYSGGVGFIVALFLNIYLMNILEKPIAYAISLAVQIHINYIFCQSLVFREAKASLFTFSLYAKFMAGVLFYRFLDWTLYSLATVYFGIGGVLMQCFNLLLFSILKYIYLKKIFVGN